MSSMSTLESTMSAVATSSQTEPAALGCATLVRVVGVAYAEDSTIHITVFERNGVSLSYIRISDWDDVIDEEEGVATPVHQVEEWLFPTSVLEAHYPYDAILGYMEKNCSFKATGTQSEPSYELTTSYMNRFHHYPETYLLGQWSTDPRTQPWNAPEGLALSQELPSGLFSKAMSAVV